MHPLIVLEMNELNFDYVQLYIEQGHLKNFKALIDKHGYCRTSSETDYEILEPWIQWVSARTGKTYAEHQVFRLGDIVNSTIQQHWEILEEMGFRVTAVSPINGANRTRSSPFWIPDPWVDTPTSGGAFLEKVSSAIRQAVNDNASEKLSLKTIRTLSRALLVSNKISSWPTYIKCIGGALQKQHWSKAVMLDRLLADIFFSLWSRHRPDFSTLFLNSAAHIQHHYLFNSKAYAGDQKNPAWYVDADLDPMLEIYELYDAILGEAVKLGARVMAATGLKQVPYEQVTFYYRLKDHKRFLNKLGVAHRRVLPRMSRDFLVECDNRATALAAADILGGLRALDGTYLFTVDNRGETLFVTLSYPHEIKTGFRVVSQDGAEILQDLHEEVSFVAIKNGHHDSEGFFMDSAAVPGELPDIFPLEDLYLRVMDHFPGK